MKRFLSRCRLKLSSWRNAVRDRLWPDNFYRKMAAARDILLDYPETAALLADAEKDGIKIKPLSDKVEFIGGHFDKIKKEICLRSVEPTRMAKLLIHELRHWQQDRILNIDFTGKAGVHNAEGKTARDNVLITRVQEADAYAFTDLMVMRMNRANEDFRELVDLIADYAGKENDKGTALLLASKEVNRKYADRNIWAEDLKATRDFFFEALETTMPYYDVIAIQHYHAHNTSPHRETTERKLAPGKSEIDMDKLRRMLIAGYGNPQYPSYIKDMSNLRFGAAVMMNLKKEPRSAMRLIDKFKRDAAKYPALDTKEVRMKIAAKVQALELPRRAAAPTNSSTLSATEPG